MKKLVSVIALAIAIVPCSAQIVFELSCPVGSVPLTQGKSLNPATGKYRAFLCIDPVNGKVTFNDQVTGTVVGTGAMVWPGAGIPVAKTSPNAWDTSLPVPDANAAHFLSGAKTWIAPPAPATMTATVGGLVPTPPNDATKFLNGAAGFTVPAAPPTMTATVGGLVPTPPNDATKFLNGAAGFTTPPSGGVTLPASATGGFMIGPGFFSNSLPVMSAGGGVNAGWADGIQLFRFVLPIGLTIGRASIYMRSNSSGHCSFAILSSDGTTKLVDSGIFGPGGSFPALQSHTFTQVSLPAGVYLYAQTDDSVSGGCSVDSFNSGAGFAGVLNDSGGRGIVGISTTTSTAGVIIPPVSLSFHGSADTTAAVLWESQ